MRFSTYCTHTHTHIWGYTYRCSYAYERHSLSGCAEFSTRKQTNSFDKPKGAPGEPTEEEKNRIEPNRTEEPKQTAQTAEKQRPNSPTFSHRLTAPKNRTEPNSKKKIPHAVCGAVRNAQWDRQTDKQTSRQTGGQREWEGGEDVERDPARSPGHGAPASHFYAVHSACSAEGEQSPISMYECI